MSYDLIELTLSRLGEQLPERLSTCLESHQTDRRSDKIRSEIYRQSVNTSGDAVRKAGDLFHGACLLTHNGHSIGRHPAHRYELRGIYAAFMKLSLLLSRIHMR